MHPVRSTPLCQKIVQNLKVGMRGQQHVSLMSKVKYFEIYK